MARERYTPLLKSARNFDGMVSRFLASRLCSKVPVKAKAHVDREAEAGQSIPGGEVGGASPPGSGFAQRKLPHFVPLCNTEPVPSPTLPHLGSEDAVLQGLCWGPILGGALQIARVNARLRFEGRFGAAVGRGRRIPSARGDSRERRVGR